jgi:F0F1-type ATP synthase assembly protein I
MRPDNRSVAAMRPIFQGIPGMTELSSRPMSNRRLLVICGTLAVALGLVVIGAGAWSGYRSMLWGGACMLAAGVFWLLCARFTREEPMRSAQRRYVREFFPAMAAYVLLLLASQALLQHVHSTALTVLIVLLPVVPTVFVVRAMVRQVLASDELERRLQLEAVSIASMSVGLLSFAAAFLRDAGLLPVHNPLMWVLPALFAAYGMANWWVRRRFRDE